jgi:Protein of unknown function (DUF1236)
MKSSVLIATIAAAFLASTAIVAAQNPSPAPEKQEQKAAPNVQKQEPKVAPQVTPKVAPKAAPEAQINVAPKAQNNAPGQAQEKTQEKTQDKAKEQPRPSAQKPAPSTTGQGNPSTAQQPAQNDRAKQNERSNGTAGQGASQPGSNAAQSQSQASGNRVALTAEQKTTIRQSVLGARNAPRAANVSFSINVGTEIPRTMHLVAVPEPIYRFHPEWSSYVYFIVGDEIIIVDARTHRIVAVLDV